MRSTRQEYCAGTGSLWPKRSVATTRSTWSPAPTESTSTVSPHGANAALSSAHANVTVGLVALSANEASGRAVTSGTVAAMRVSGGVGLQSGAAVWSARQR